MTDFSVASNISGTFCRFLRKKTIVGKIHSPVKAERKFDIKDKKNLQKKLLLIETISRLRQSK
jgi:hypothetical protein